MNQDKKLKKSHGRFVFNNEIMNKKHTGTLSEIKACVWLIENGYEVFRNISQYGPIDLIAIKDGEIIKIDVTTANLYKKADGGRTLCFAKEKLKKGCHVMIVLGDEIHLIPPSIEGL